MHSSKVDLSKIRFLYFETTDDPTITATNSIMQGALKKVVHCLRKNFQVEVDEVRNDLVHYSTWLVALTWIYHWTRVMCLILFAAGLAGGDQELKIRLRVVVTRDDQGVDARRWFAAPVRLRERRKGTYRPGSNFQSFDQKSVAHNFSIEKHFHGRQWPRFTSKF